MQTTSFSYKHKHYPAFLTEIAQPPKELFVLGNLKPENTYVAIVGTRRPTSYGKQVTYRLAYDLAKAGLTIVSGLALGVDGIAHRAAIEAGGHTIAVLGTGLTKIQPPSHRNLALDILKHGGALVSEFNEEIPYHEGIFPQRNRIISGLSSGVLVTEAAVLSGSLITAKYANEQGRMVMAVPGQITNTQSAGPNNLLKDGAIAVTDVTDVLSAINFDSGKVQNVPVKADSKEEAIILDLLTQGVSQTQDLIEQSQLEASQFANIITLMEISGKVRNLGAGSWMVR